MNVPDFNTQFDQLTAQQRRVLREFLTGKSDDDIAASLHCSASTVRNHLANICKVFRLTNEPGERFSYREELIALCARYRPELVNPELLPQVIELEYPEGQVPLNSAFYVPRPPIEEQCHQNLTKPGALIRIKAPKLMGKTSLMARILDYGATQNYRTVEINLLLADRPVLSNLDTFLRWFCVSVGRQLQLDNQVSDRWEDFLGSSSNCTAYFSDYILPQSDRPLVLAIDEIDRIFAHPGIAQDFLGLLRTWHEKAKNPSIWQKLRLVLVHATEVYIQLNLHQSPFNVGLAIELPELTPTQGQELAHRHGLSTPIKPLMALIGGHPYLMRLALYSQAAIALSLDQLITTAACESSIYSNHLRRLWGYLRQDEELVAAMKRIVSEAQPVELEPLQTYKLHSMGLVQRQGNAVTSRCQLYASYFRRVL